MTRRVLLVLFICLFALPAFAAGGGEDSGGAAGMEGTTDDPRLFEPGKLTVATGEPVYPPWMMDDDPYNGEGFESALVYALAEELGFDRGDVVWVRATFDEGIAPGAKSYDFNIQQYSITEDRREFVTFSEVYYQPDKAVVALPGSGISDARTLADLQSADWGATIGTTDLDYIENIIGADDVAVYNDQVGTFQALLAGQIDGTVISGTRNFYSTVQQYSAGPTRRRKRRPSPQSFPRIPTRRDSGSSLRRTALSRNGLTKVSRPSKLTVPLPRWPPNGWPRQVGFRRSASEVSASRAAPAGGTLSQSPRQISSSAHQRHDGGGGDPSHSHGRGAG